MEARAVLVRLKADSRYSKIVRVNWIVGLLSSVTLHIDSRSIRRIIVRWRAVLAGRVESGVGRRARFRCVRAVRLGARCSIPLFRLFRVCSSPEVSPAVVFGVCAVFVVLELGVVVLVPLPPLFVSLLPLFFGSQPRHPVIEASALVATPVLMKSRR